MTTEERQSPAAEKHSPEEIVEKVKQTQERHEIPAVSSREAAKLLDYKDDYVTTKLNRMVDNGYLKGYKTGAGYIYWVPGEGEAGGEVDVSSIGSPEIDHENLDPADVPQEQARQIAESNLPEFGDDNWWQDRYKTGYSMIQAGGVGFGIGIGIFLVDSPIVEGYNVPEVVLQAGAILMASGSTVLAISALLMMFSYFGQQAVERGWLPAEPSISLPW